jgi:hypothetical protein
MTSLAATSAGLATYRVSEQMNDGGNLQTLINSYWIGKIVFEAAPRPVHTP